MRFTLYVDYSLLQKKGEESLECKLQKLLENKVTHLKVVSVFFLKEKNFLLLTDLNFQKIRKFSTSKNRLENWVLKMFVFRC